jgi:hypothetical protein
VAEGIVVGVVVEIVEPVGGMMVGAGMLVWAQAGNRKIMSRRTDLRYLAIAPSMRKLIPEFYANINLPSFSPKLSENFDGALLSLALFCHSAYIFAINFSKLIFLKRFHHPGLKRLISMIM